MFDIDRFIGDCRAALAERSPELAIKELLERAVAHPADVEAALGTLSEGQLTALHQSPDLTILNVIWTPGMVIYPHEHRMWAILGLYGGREDNTFYRRAPGGLATAGGRHLYRGDVAVLGRAVIHSVANPLREFTGAIHIYGGDFFGTPRTEWDPDTLQERPFDVARARRTFAEANERWRAECAGVREFSAPLPPGAGR
jgi:predicted metal-dependent enzyme (double-stranded beta helix superfamily)